MNQHQSLTIGLFGFGVVGEGLYKVLQQTPSLKAVIKLVCIKHADKARNAPKELFTTDKDLLLNDPDINVIVEVINESDEAFRIVSAALSKGKAVVSASKKMIAENFPALLSLQSMSGCSLLYEAAAGASIPIIRNLEEYYDNDLLHSMRGIVNGSTNYILTKMFEAGMEFHTALSQAQTHGFAETDPRLDIEGTDAMNKWTFLLTHAYGIIPAAGTLIFAGIEHITVADARVATEKKCTIRLVAHAQKLKNGRVAAFILPQWVELNDPLAFVREEYNGVVIESSFADKQFFYGKGAGSFPTASAVLSDLSALRYGYRYEYKKLYHHGPHLLSDDYYLKAYIGFDDWSQIPKDSFEWTEEWHSNEGRHYIIAVMHCRELTSSLWWKTKGVSFILSYDPVIDDMDIRRLKQRSLELAGVRL